LKLPATLIDAMNDCQESNPAAGALGWRPWKRWVLQRTLEKGSFMPRIYVPDTFGAAPSVDKSHLKLRMRLGDSFHLARNASDRLHAVSHAFQVRLSYSGILSLFAFQLKCLVWFHKATKIVLH